MKITTLVLFSSVLALTACGGGGGGASPTPVTHLAGPGGQVAGGGSGVSINGVNFTHDQAAQAFLAALNAESGNETSTSCDDQGDCSTYASPGPVYAVTKSDTQQSGYAVVSNGTGGYMAVYVDGWNGTTDPMTYYENNGSTFQNVFSVGGGNFEDPVSGILFSAAKPSSKDLEKQAAFTEAVYIKKSAKTLQGFGFSEERSTSVAKLASQMEKAPKGSMTDQDYDNFAKELTGSSITQIKNALQKQSQGESGDLKSIIDTAADANGVGSEQMKQMLGKVVGQPVVD